MLHPQPRPELNFCRSHLRVFSAIVCRLTTTPVIHKRLNTVHLQPFFYPLLTFRCLAMWRLCPETTTVWLGPSPGLRGEKRRLLQIFFFSAWFHTCIQQWQGLKNKRLTKSGWQITKNIFPLLNNEFQRVFLVLIESSKPKNIANFTERSAHIIRHCCWHLLSWLARTPRAVILGLFELNCD